MKKLKLTLALTAIFAGITSQPNPIIIATIPQLAIAGSFCFAVNTLNKYYQDKNKILNGPTLSITQSNNKLAEYKLAAYSTCIIIATICATYLCSQKSTKAKKNTTQKDKSNENSEQSQNEVLTELA